jgi:hypothetical protein
MIDARITSEYVVCGVCLTKNRIVAHKRVLRPVCGRCGYPLPDPFGAQPRFHLFGEWITRHRRTVVATIGLLVLGSLLWVVHGTDERSLSSSNPQTSLPDVTLSDDHGAPVDAVAVVVQPDSSLDGRSERDDLLLRSPPPQADGQSNAVNDSGTPNAGSSTMSGSVVIMVDVSTRSATGHIEAGSSPDRDPSGVVEQIHISDGQDPNGERF